MPSSAATLLLRTAILSNPLHFELPRMQHTNIRTRGLAIKDPLRHQQPRPRSILHAPARMPGSNPHTRNRRRPDERSALGAEADVLRDVAGLLGLDGRCGEDGRDGAEVGGQVVALAFVGLDLVCCFWEGDVLVGLAWWVCQSLASCLIRCEGHGREENSTEPTHHKHKPLQTAAHTPQDPHSPYASASAPPAPYAQAHSPPAAGYP